MALVSDTAEQKLGQVILEKRVFYAAKRLGSHTRNSLRFETRTMVEYIDEMLATLQAEILMERVGGEKYTTRFSYPATWWDMLKFRHFPRWLRKGFPVRWKTYKRNVTVERFVAYPGFDRVLPDYFGKTVLKYFTDENGDELKNDE